MTCGETQDRSRDFSAHIAFSVTLMKFFAQWLRAISSKTDLESSWDKTAWWEWKKLCADNGRISETCSSLNACKFRFWWRFIVFSCCKLLVINNERRRRKRERSSQRCYRFPILMTLLSLSSSFFLCLPLIPYDDASHKKAFSTFNPNLMFASVL